MAPNCKPEGAYAVLAYAQQLEAQGRHILHLEIGQPDFPTFAAHPPGGHRRDPPGKTRYNPPGVPRCARSSPKMPQRRQGFPVSPAGGDRPGCQAGAVLPHPGAGRAG